MKKNYFFKPALIVVALFSFGAVFAQTAKIPNFVENVSPVINGTTSEDFTFAFECSAAWGDYNNDGYMDLITSGVSNNWVKMTILYKNNGNGTFTKITTPFDNLDAANITWLDFNNDGNLDVILAGKDDIGYYTAIYKNLGAAGNYDFQEVNIGSLEYVNNGGGNRANRYIIPCDYNNDGWVDLYLQGENETGRHSFLYKNLKGKGFEKIENPVNGVQPFIQLNGGSAAFADYDGDGYQDLIVSGYAATTDSYAGGYTGARYHNNGDGTFAAPVLFDGTESGELAWCDYNNDGKWDYIVTGVGANASGWYWKSDIYENNGDGTFTRIPAEQSGLPNNKQETSIAWGDVNNDGYEDLLYMNTDPNSIFLNNFGDQTFAKYKFTYTEPVSGSSSVDYTYQGNQWGGTACLVDYDRDGNLDAFTAAYGFNPRLMKNQLGEGITSNQAPTAPTNLASSIDQNGNVNLSWTAATDDATLTEALKYNVYVKKNGNDSVSFLLPADITTGRLKVNETLAPLNKTTYKIKGLTNGTYTFGVQAIDNSKLGGHFATAQFLVGPSAVKSDLESKVSVFSDNKLIRISTSADMQGVISVFNANGLTVYSKTGNINNTKVSLPAGVYIVKVTSDKNSLVEKAILR
ncbi:MAG: FG-GAP-like repeat-containing protein [Paludibacter sp.]|nr:FG-GAP-like repeat-containing protein [Paludibacter sp.]